MQAGSSTYGKAVARDKVADPAEVVLLPHCPDGRIPGSLSAVAMKALAVPSGERHASVADVIADIEAFQRGFATSAEEIGALGQLALFVKRHKGISVAAGIALLLIISLSAGFIIKVNSEKQAALASDKTAREEAANAREAERVAQTESARALAALAKAEMGLAEQEYERGNVYEAERLVEGIQPANRSSNWQFLRNNIFQRQVRFTGLRNVSINYPLYRHRFTAGKDGARNNLHLLDVRGARSMWSFPESITQHDIHPQGDQVACLTEDLEIIIRDLETRKELNRFKISEKPEQIRLSPKGKFLLTVDKEKATLYESQQGKALWVKKEDWIGGAFNPDRDEVGLWKQRVWGGQLKVTVSLCDARSGKQSRRVENSTEDLRSEGNPHSAGQGKGLHFHSDNKGITVMVWNRAFTWLFTDKGHHLTGKPILRHGSQWDVSPNGACILARDGQQILLLNTLTGKVIRSIHGKRDGTQDIWSLRFHPNGQTISFTQNWKHITTATGIAKPVLTAKIKRWPYSYGPMAFNKDESRLFIGDDVDLQSWTIPDLDPSAKFEFKRQGGHQSVNGLLVHPKTGELYGHWRGQLQDWLIIDPKTAKQKKQIPLKDLNGIPLQFSRDGTKVLVRAGENSGAHVRLHANDGELLFKIPADQNPFHDYAVFCHNDERIATGVPIEGNPFSGISFWDWRNSKRVLEIPVEKNGQHPIHGGCARRPAHRHRNTQWMDPDMERGNGRTGPCLSGPLEIGHPNRVVS